jgi:hypothetical protein
VPDKFDVHDKHIKELNDFRKSPRYRMLGPDEQAIFEDHAVAHEVMAAEDMGRARTKAAIDPALAAVPDANGGPSLAPSEVSPADMPAGMEGMMPSEPGLPPEEGGMPVNEEAAEAGPGAPTAGTVVPPPA